MRKGRIIKPDIEPGNKFIVLNEKAQVWSGLSKGKAVFSDRFEDARELVREEQFRTLQHVSDFKLTKEYV